MTNAELIATIRNEIERQKTINKSLLEGQLKDGCLYAFNQVLNFLSTLESEKPINQDGFSKEFDDYFLQKNREQKGRWGFAKIYDLARHFYELGCTRTAEKFDEIEYNRQRAEEKIPNNKVIEGEVILNGHGLLANVTKWGDGYKLKIIIKED